MEPKDTERRRSRHEKAGYRVERRRRSIVPLYVQRYKLCPP